jgi:peptidoglycan/LPS O-acetylase OafA/YrhL
MMTPADPTAVITDRQHGQFNYFQPIGMRKANSPIHFPDLDGLRAIAAFAVILYHIGGWVVFPSTIAWERTLYLLSFAEHGGELGVLFFFVLSGFLITYLMLVERERTGRLHIGRFYLRRVLRIWPLYFLTLLVGFAICPSGPDAAATPLMYAAFLTNFDHILHGDPDCGPLGIQWSIAVEEQFYLLWPLFFAVVGGHRAFPWLLLLLVTGSEAYALQASAQVAHYHFVANLRYLTAGALIATLLHEHGDRVQRLLARWPTALHATTHALGLSLLFVGWRAAPVHSGVLAVLHVYTVLYFLYVLVHQTHGPISMLHLRHAPVLGWLGRISYGLYLMHMFVIYAVLHLLPWPPERGWVAATVIVAVTILVSYASHRTIERYFLGLKHRYGASTAE